MYHGIEEVNKRVIEIICIENDHGFDEHPKSLQAEGFHEFFHGSASPGQGDDGINIFNHEFFALRHGICPNHFSKILMVPFYIFHEVGHNTNCSAAHFIHLIGQYSHQSGSSAAKNKLYVVVSKYGSKFDSMFDIYRCEICTGCTIDADAFYFHIIYCQVKIAAL